MNNINNNNNILDVRRILNLLCKRRRLDLEEAQFLQEQHNILLDMDDKTQKSLQGIEDTLSRYINNHINENSMSLLNDQQLLQNFQYAKHQYIGDSLNKNKMSLIKLADLINDRIQGYVVGDGQQDDLTIAQIGQMIINLRNLSNALRGNGTSQA